MNNIYMIIIFRLSFYFMLLLIRDQISNFILKIKLFFKMIQKYSGPQKFNLCYFLFFNKKPH